MSPSAPSPAPPSPSSHSPSFFHGYGTRTRTRTRTRARVLLVVVPLVFVSLLVLAADSYSSVPWFSRHTLFFSPSAVDGGAGNGSGDAISDGGVAVGNGTVSSPNYAPSNSNVPLLPPARRASPAMTSPTSPPQQSANSEDHGNRTRNVLKPALRMRRDVKLERLERGLAKARAAIREALRINATSNTTIFDKDYVPRDPIYRNARAFHR